MWRVGGLVGGTATNCASWDALLLTACPAGGAGCVKWHRHELRFLECRSTALQALQEELGVSLPARREAAEARLASFREQLRGIEGQLDGLAHRLQVSAPGRRAAKWGDGSIASARSLALGSLRFIPWRTERLLPQDRINS